MNDHLFLSFSSFSPVDLYLVLSLLCGIDESMDRLELARETKDRYDLDCYEHE